MSLLAGNTTIEVFPETAGTDEYGNPVTRPGDPTADTPVPVRCLVQPSTTEENASIGLQVGTSYRVLSLDFPGGAQALIRHDGRLWDVVGEPKRYTGSPGTAHTTTFITARTTRAV